MPKRTAPLTHCKRGHPFDAENTYINPTSGHMQCRICNKARQKWSQTKYTEIRRRALAQYKAEAQKEKEQHHAL